MASRLEQLPGELLNKILDQLCYLDAVRLCRVSRHFFSILKPQQWPVEQKVAEIHEVERWERHNRVFFANRFDSDNIKKLTVITDGFACFGCFKVLDKSKFARNQTERQGAKSSYSYFHLGHRRCCIDCCLEFEIYNPGTIIHVVTGGTWGINHGRMSLVHKEVTRLLVCTHCNEASEFVPVGPPQVFLGCGEIQTQIDGSEEGAATMKMRKYRYEIVECLGCHGQNSIKVQEKMLRCEGCDESICKKCFGSKSPDCKCEESEDSLLGLKRLFNSMEESKAITYDLFDEEEGAELLEILDIFAD